MHDVPIDTKLPDTPGQSARSERLRASPPMFRWRWLDHLSRVHPVVPPLIFLPAIAILAVAACDAAVGGDVRDRRSPAATFSGPSASTGFTASMFHFEPEDGIGARLHWMMHGVHHDHPNDPLRLVMPPAVSVPLAALFLAVFVLVVGTPLAWAVGAGFLAGYLFYDMLHYALHHHRHPRPRSSGGCASCTCATTSRTTNTATGSARRGGISSSARSRDAAAASGFARSPRR